MEPEQRPYLVVMIALSGCAVIALWFGFLGLPPSATTQAQLPALPRAQLPALGPSAHTATGPVVPDLARRAAQNPFQPPRALTRALEGVRLVPPPPPPLALPDVPVLPLGLTP